MRIQIYTMNNPIIRKNNINNDISNNSDNSNLNMNEKKNSLTKRKFIDETEKKNYTKKFRIITNNK